MTKHDPVLHHCVCVLVALAIVVICAGLVVLRPTPGNYGQAVKFDRATGHLEFIK